MYSSWQRKTCAHLFMNILSLGTIQNPSRQQVGIFIIKEFQVPSF